MRIIPGVEPQNPTLLWLALAFRRAKQTKSYERALKDLFAGAVNRHYHCLFAQPTLLGPRDISLLAPLVVDAGKKLKDERSVQGLASKLGLAGLSYHPGYTLRISSLGNLRVWRGQEEIGGREWQREKALELFLLLLMNRGKYLPKETLYDLLWPEEDEDTAARNFKVSLNALRKALEPDRKAQEDSYYVLRNRSNYGFNSDAGYVFDVEEFERLLAQGDREKDKKRQNEYYHAAIKLYQGDFLADVLYVDWVQNERERLKSAFLNTLDKLVRYYYLIDDNEQALQLANLLLEHDSCWEPAYLLKMKIHHRLNRPFVAIKVYEQCQTVLERELGVTPMPEIEKYYQELIAGM